MRQQKIRDVMTTNVISIPADTSFKDAVRILTSHRVSGVPVVNRHGKVLGVLSEVDLVRREAELPRHWLRPLVPARRRSAPTVVGDLLTTPAVTTTPDTTVAAAARQMVRHGYARLPVVDDKGRLVGIVCPKDLLGVFLRSDAEIAESIEHEVFEQQLWITVTPATVSVDVHDGVVTLAGCLERKSMIAVAVALTQRVDGVVDVIDNLTFAEDDTYPRHSRTFNVDAATERWPA